MKTSRREILLEIVALQVDSKQLTLWDKEGKPTYFPQGDARVALIVQEARDKGLTTGKPVTVNIAVINTSKEEYYDTEKNSGGIIKFLRIARKKLVDFLTDAEAEMPPKPVNPIKLGGFSVTSFEPVQIKPTISAVAAPVVQPSGDDWAGYLWVTGWDESTNIVELVKAFRRMPASTGSLKIASEMRNWPWPIKVTGRQTKEYMSAYTEILSKVPGVAFVVLEDNSSTPPAYVPVQKAQTNADKLAAASARLEELGAVTSDSPEFAEELKEDETIVAVVGDKVIPDVQHLHRQVRQSSKLKDFSGFTAFLQRLSTIVSERRHSAEDLMKFMEHGDLPIADDGSIVIFKLLRKTDTVGEFVDCYTKKIKQRIGSRVQVDAHLVDPDRRVDCSNGLHVAARSYLRSYGGDVIVIAKVAPEDVFAVPEYNNNKMRVAAYDIIDVVTPEMQTALLSNRPITDCEGGLELLNKVLTGNHPAPNQLVKVMGHLGGNVRYIDLTEEKATEDQDIANLVRSDAPIREALNMDAKLEAEVAIAEPVDAKSIKAAPAKAPTKVEQMQELWDKFQKAETSEVATDLANQMFAIKVASKKQWSLLGISSAQVDAIAAARATGSKPAPVRTKEEIKAAAPKVDKPAKSSGKAETIRGYLNDDGMTDYAKAHAIHDLKRAAKKGYFALGLTPDEVNAIQKLVKLHVK